MIEGPGCSDAGLRHRLPFNVGQDADGVDIGELSLARSHAEGRVPLHQLDLVKTLLRSVDEVLVMHVLVKIDKAFRRWVRKDGIGMSR